MNVHFYSIIVFKQPLKSNDKGEQNILWMSFLSQDGVYKKLILTLGLSKSCWWVMHLKRSLSDQGHAVHNPHER